MKFFGALCLVTMAAFGFQAEAASRAGQKVAVSQGISSPTITSPVNFSHGLTYNNSAVAAQLQGVHITGELTNNSGFGGEAGLGNGSAGISLGYFKPNCGSCNGRFGGIAGLGGARVAGGIGFREGDIYSAGVLLNPNGLHRFGAALDFQSSPLVSGDLTSYGIGYSYAANAFTFALDASRRDGDGPRTSNGVMMITPGLEVHNDWLALSVSYDLYANDNNGVFDDGIWIGGGINGERWNLALYYDYFSEWSGVATFWF